MVYTYRLLAPLALLLLASGCKPFQQSATTPFQATSAEVKQVANRASRQLANQQANPTAIGNKSADQEFPSPENVTKLADSAPTTDAPCHANSGHSDSGYCSSCGVTHGADGKSSPFRFTEPLPSFQPVARPQSPQPLGQSSSDPNLMQTYSSAVRVKPLQPEEARSSALAQNPPAGTPGEKAQKAPPPEPDDAPAVSEQTPTVAAVGSPVNGSSPAAGEPSGNTKTKLDTTLSATTASVDSAMPKSSTADATLVTEANSEPEPAEAGCETETSPDLARTIQTLRQRLGESDASEMNESLAAGLNALELLAVRVQDLAAGLSQPTDAQALCKHQLQALVATLRPDALDISRPEGRQVASTTLEHLRDAITELEKLVSLKVTDGALCSEVRGFGQYKPFAVNQFRPGQPVLLYCEIENFCSAEEQGSHGNTDYRTRLKSSLVICKADGTVAQQAEFPVVEDVARNRRRDFYLYVPFTVGDLSPGEYRVHLMVDDQQGHKQAVLDPPVTFTVQ